MLPLNSQVQIYIWKAKEKNFNSNLKLYLLTFGINEDESGFFLFKSERIAMNLHLMYEPIQSILLNMKKNITYFTLTK